MFLLKLVISSSSRIQLTRNKKTKQTMCEAVRVVSDMHVGAFGNGMFETKNEQQVQAMMSYLSETQVHVEQPSTSSNLPASVLCLPTTTVVLGDIFELERGIPYCSTRQKQFKELTQTTPLAAFLQTGIEQGKYLFVRGNHDEMHFTSTMSLRAPKELLLTVQDTRIYLTHGDLADLNQSCYAACRCWSRPRWTQCLAGCCGWLWNSSSTGKCDALGCCTEKMPLFQSSYDWDRMSGINDQQLVRYAVRKFCQAQPRRMDVVIMGHTHNALVSRITLAASQQEFLYANSGFSSFATSSHKINESKSQGDTESEVYFTETLVLVPRANAKTPLPSVLTVQSNRLVLQPDGTLQRKLIAVETMEKKSSS